MADFCKQCSQELFGPDSEGDFVDCCAPGILYVAICEGCGYDAVMDHTGACVSADCLKKHGTETHPWPKEGSRG